MLNEIKVLDESNISFDIEDDLLKVFDQNDQLVGETSLPIPIEEGMDIETIYSVAEGYGYNIGELLEHILTDAVMERRDYDLWLTEENMIFYSPSAGQFVAEPYIGLFAAIGDYFENREVIEDESHGSYVDYEEVVEQDEYDEGEYQESNSPNESQEEDIYEEEYTELDNSDEDEDYEEVEEYMDEETYQEDYNDDEDEQEYEEETPEATYEGETEDNFDSAYNERFGEDTNKFEDELSPEEYPEVLEETEGDETQDAPFNEELVKEWKDSYMNSLKDRKKVDGVSLSSLRDEVLDIILEKETSVFNITENEILFELAERTPVLFDAKNAIKAGLYQAYLIEKEDQ